MAVKKEELIRKYTKAIREGNAAVFGGAGLSRPSGFVDWKGLLRPLAEEIDLNVDKETDLLSVAQFYRNRKGTRTSINQTIVDAFSKDIDANDNIKILTRLPIYTYWTTNYDELIEDGIREANRNPDVKSESDQLSIMKPDRDAIVYKMHGDINRPAKAVLTKTDYELYEYNRPLFRTALKGDLVSKVFLFIGFSFEDPNLEYILGQIHSLLGENVPEHYCFFKRVQREDYISDEDYGYDMAKQDMQEENLRNYGIQTVFVDSYSEITEILHEIEKNSKMKNVFISGSIEEYPDHWNEEKVNEFVEKLAGALVKIDCRISTGFGWGIGSAVVNGALNIIYKDKYRHVDEHLCLRPFPQHILNPADREERQRRYREDILDETGIAIFIFGNKIDGATKKNVIADGCIKEFEIAREKSNIIIPIGSTGFAAKEIYENVRQNMDDYLYLSSYIEQLGTEENIDSIIDIIIEIVKSQII